MTINVDPPRPGDVITSDLIRQMLQELSALGTRVTFLESLTPGSRGELVITDITPNDVMMGTEIRIKGVNFGSLDGRTTVTFDGGNPRSTFKPGSGDTLLVLDVPALSFSGDDRSVAVGVSNGSGGFDHRFITVSKPVATVPTGTVTVTHKAWPLVSMIPHGGGEFVFTFAAQMLASTLDETFDVTASLPSGWTWTLTADATGLVERPKQLFLPRPPGGTAGDLVPMFVKLKIPTTVANTASLEVQLRSQRNPSQFFGTSGPITFPIGSPLPGIGTISFALPPAVLGPGASVSGSDVTFSAPTPPNRLGQITLTALELKANTSYHVTIDWQDGESRGWSANVSGDPLNTSQALEFTMGRGGNHSFQIFVRADGSADAAQLNVTIVDTDNPSEAFGATALVINPA